MRGRGREGQRHDVENECGLLVSFRFVMTSAGPGGVNGRGRSRVVRLFPSLVQAVSVEHYCTSIRVD